VPYVSPASKHTPADLAASKKEQVLAALKNSASLQSGGSAQPGGASPVPTTIALNGSDSCASPDPIAGVGSFAFDNSTATTGTQGQNENICFQFNHTAIANDVWFVWTASSTGTASMTLCNFTGMDSKIAAYNGSTCPLPQTALACNDDNCALQSSISFPCTAGNNYMLQLGNYYNASGSFGSFTMSIVAGAPPNDNCSAAIPISGLGPWAFDTTGATTSPQQSGSCGVAGQDIWYNWTASGTGTATLSLCGTSFDSLVAVYAGAGCPGGGTIWCNDDSCALQSQVSFPCTAGNVYAVQIGGYLANSGPGSFSFNVVGGGGPANDDCGSAIAISGAGPFNFDTTTATTSTQQSGACNNAGQDIWYDWTAGSTGVATVALCNSTFDTVVAVYAGAGCPSAGTNWCNDDNCGVQSQIAFPCVAGGVYSIQVGGYTIAAGQGSFTVNVGPQLPNDSCSTPTAIAGNGTFPFDNVTATTGFEGQTENLCLAFGLTTVENDVWFAWTSPASGTATLTLCNLGGGMDSKIAVYAGSSCPTPGSALACNDDTCAYESEVTFPATAGSTYMLQIGTYAGTIGAQGSLSINVGGGSVTYLCDPGASGVIGCPCANPPSGSGRGCNNSSATGGASIQGAGSTTLSNPTLAFTTAGEKPTATTILLQGTSPIAAGTVFGQGVRCVGGTLKRLYVRAAVGGSVTLPNFGLGDLDIPTRSANLGDPISAGQSRWYMAYYRDPIVLGGCSALSTFNSTSAAAVAWQ
jgi:hypothetical protein